MLTEQALGQRPVIGQLMHCFQPAMHPHGFRNGAVLDAVACVRVVGDNLPSTTSAHNVVLVKHGETVPGRSNTIFLHESLRSLLAELSGKESDKSVLWRE